MSILPQLKKISAWRHCQECGLHKTRRQVVLGKGNPESDIMFIGIGPGKSEDLIGRPFCGPSGVLLREGMKAALKLTEKDDGAREPEPDLFVTNVVACRPCDTRTGPNRDPTKEESFHCLPRLKLEYQFADPLVVVLLGKVTEDLCGKHFLGAMNLRHPAFMLRSGGTESAAYGDFVRGLVDVFEAVRKARRRRDR